MSSQEIHDKLVAFILKCSLQYYTTNVLKPLKFWHKHLSVTFCLTIFSSLRILARYFQIHSHNFSFSLNNYKFVNGSKFCAQQFESTDCMQVTLQSSFLLLELLRIQKILGSILTKTIESEVFGGFCQALQMPGQHLKTYFLIMQFSEAQCP
jgi:hypothetical protein